jgi:hypothetical protein
LIVTTPFERNLTMARKQQRRPKHDAFECENDSDIATALARIGDQEVVAVVSTDVGEFNMAKIMASLVGHHAAAMKPDDFARVLAAGGKAAGGKGESAKIVLIEAGRLKRLFQAA